MIAHPHVELRQGVPFVKDTGVPVARLWDLHREGVLVATLMKRYPAIQPGTLLDALAFAYDNRELVEPCAQART